MNEKDLKSAVRSFAKQSGRKGIGLKIFETSGTAAGQQTAFGLLDFGAYLAVVGYTAEESGIPVVEPDGVRRHGARELGLSARNSIRRRLIWCFEGKVAIAPYVEAAPTGGGSGSLLTQWPTCHPPPRHSETFYQRSQDH